MKINSFDLDKRLLVVAEIGNNHEGSFEVAKELVRKAAECGVDAVKFQVFRTEYFVSRSNIERFNKLKSFELSYSQFEQLAKLAHSLGLLFISTPLDLQSSEFLENIVDVYKIASGDNNFYALINKVARTNKPLIISTGLSDINQVQRTVDFVRETCRISIEEKLALLHCVATYPVPIDQANLLAIKFLSDKTGLTVGYSDHTIGIDASLLAVAFGARIVEKHFTLDHNYSSFRDHQLSADPEEMKTLVQKIRSASLMLGSYDKTIQKCEEPNIQAIRRSIVASKDLKEGQILDLSDLAWTRPADGLLPGEESRLIGRTLKRDIIFGEKLYESDVK